MLEKTMKWDTDSEKAIEEMIDLVRESVIANAEMIAKATGSNSVDAKAMEISLYKSVMTLNEVNKAILIRKLGLEHGSRLIESLERRAMSEVTDIVYEEVMANYDQFPEEIKKLLDMMKNDFDRKDNEENE